MAERMGRIGRGGDRWEIAREAEADPGARGVRPRGRGPTSLLAMAVSGLVLYLTWWVLWDQSHPASSAAWRLRQRDPAARLEAIRDLGNLGAHDPEVAVPALILGLSDPDPSNRATAAECLVAVTQGFGSAGPDPEQVREAMAAMLGCLDDPVAAVRPRAAQAIATIVRSWPGSARALDLDALEGAMTRLAEDPDDELRSIAMQGLCAVALRSSEGPPPRAIAALEDRSDQVRQAAAHGLAPFHRALVGLLPSLVVAAEKARPECRPAYFHLLRWFRPAEYPRELVGELVLALIAALETKDREVRCQVIAMLGEFGPDARAAIPPLLRILADPAIPEAEGPGYQGFAQAHDPAIAAAEALRRLSQDLGLSRPASAPEIVAALLKLMASPAAGRRLAAVHALSASFEADDAIVGAFIGACGDGDEWVRGAALQALQGRGARLRLRALEAIREAMEDPSPRVRSSAAYALHDFGAGVEPMVPALIRHAEGDPDPEVRAACADALGRIGPSDVTDAIVPMYCQAIDRPGAPDRLRRSLIQGLIAFGAPARGAVPTIARALRSTGPEAGPAPGPGLGVASPRSSAEERAELRCEAARALGALAPGTPWVDAAVAALIAAVDDPVDEVNQGVTEALVTFGAAARGAAPALLRDLDRARARRDRLRAGRMAEAIARIDPAAPGTAEVVAFLREVLRSDDHPARLFAERVLALFGPAAASALPELVELARRPAIQTSPELCAVATALGRIAPETPGADPALAALLEGLRSDPKSPTIEAIIEALARFGPGAAAALPRLRELADSGDPPVAEAARKAVALVLPEAKSPRYPD